PARRSPTRCRSRRRRRPRRRRCRCRPPRCRARRRGPACRSECRPRRGERRMTTVFVYEYCCAAGPGRDESDPARSLHREGRAMRDAVAEDFRRVPDVEVVTLDGPLDDEPGRFRSAAAGCDSALVIAPEFDGILAARCEWALAAGRRLLGPGPEAVRLTADKLELARHWRAAGVPTPET